MLLGEMLLGEMLLGKVLLGESELGELLLSQITKLGVYVELSKGLQFCIYFIMTVQPKRKLII